MKKFDWAHLVIVIAMLVIVGETGYQAYLSYEHFQLQLIIDRNRLETIKQQAEILRLKNEAAKAFQQSISCLANNIYYEAASEPKEGQAAVAQVTLNRLHDPDRPKTVCGIVYEPGQFTWTKHPLKRVNHRAYKSAVQLAKRFLTRKEKSAIIGTDVKFYHAASVSPLWAQDHEIVATIGNHIFYK